jgi:hypothetical protein
VNGPSEATSNEGRSVLGQAIVKEGGSFPPKAIEGRPIYPVDACKKRAFFAGGLMKNSYNKINGINKYPKKMEAMDR